jgi:PAS domain S-box-containing protein
VSKVLRVLLLESSEDDAELVVGALRRGGYEPRWRRVETIAALEAALRDAPWDVLTCEYALPDCDARAALPTVSQLAPDLPVIVVSGQVDEEVAVTAMRAGAHDYVSKQRLARLVPAVERELAEADGHRARRAAERALRASAEQLRVFVENTPAAVAMLDRDMRYLACSRRWLTDYRLSDRDLIGRSHYDVFSEVSSAWRDVHQRCLAGAVERGEEDRFERDDGTVDWVRWEVRPWHEASGAIGGIVMFTEVVTERRRAEERLRASEEKYRELVETVNDVIFALDGEGRITYLSPVFEATSRYRIDELIGQPFTSYVHPEDLEEVLGNLRRTLAGISKPGEFRVVDKDGTVRWVRSFSRPIFDGDRFVALRGVLTDITERRHAEESYRAVFDHSLEGLAVVQDGRTVMVNSALAGITGYGVDELTDRSLAELAAILVHPEDREIVLADLRLGEMAVPQREFRLVRRDGSLRHVLTTTSALHYAGNAATLVALVDITERWRAENALRRLNLELEARVADRTAQLAGTAHELDAFSYSVSHDLRAPLRAIDGFTHAVLEDSQGALPPVCVDHLQRVRRATHHMGELIDQLLILSRVMRGEIRREPVDLSALARQVAADLAADPTNRAAPRNVFVAVADGLTTVGDAVLLRAVLANLLGNAWKFTRLRQSAQIEFGRGDGRLAPYFVRDNGVGFEMAYADQLFRAFQRLHTPDEFEGSGIGLATVQRIVHRHGGRIWAEGAVGEGATFYFTLG